MSYENALMFLKDLIPQVFETTTMWQVFASALHVSHDTVTNQLIDEVEDLVKAMGNFNKDETPVFDEKLRVLFVKDQDNGGKVTLKIISDTMQ